MQINNSNDILIAASISAFAGIIIALIHTFGMGTKKIKEYEEEIEEMANELHKYREIEFGFNIVFAEYEEKWKNEPEKLVMLRKLKTKFEN